MDSPEAQTILDAEGDGAAIVDVRRNDEWVTGHAAGAIHIPIDDLLDRVDELPEGKEAAFHLRRRCTQRLGLRDGGFDGFRP